MRRSGTPAVHGGEDVRRDLAAAREREAALAAAAWAEWAAAEAAARAAARAARATERAAETGRAPLDLAALLRSVVERGETAHD